MREEWDGIVSKSHTGGGEKERSPYNLEKVCYMLNLFQEEIVI